MIGDIIHSMTPSPIFGEGRETRPVIFGDKQEFALGDLIEHTDQQGRIEEAVLLFHGAGKVYALNLEREAEAPEPVFVEADSAVKAKTVDPSLVFRILSLGSADILKMAVEIDLEN